jgi:hypothetical protein
VTAALTAAPWIGLLVAAGLAVLFGWLWRLAVADRRVARDALVSSSTRLVAERKAHQVAIDALTSECETAKGALTRLLKASEDWRHEQEGRWSATVADRDAEIAELRRLLHAHVTPALAADRSESVARMLSGEAQPADPADRR